MPRKNPFLYLVQVGKETITVHFRQRKRTADSDTLENLYFDFCYHGKQYRGSTQTRDLRLAEIAAAARVR